MSLQLARPMKCMYYMAYYMNIHGLAGCMPMAWPSKPLRSAPIRAHGCRHLVVDVVEAGDIEVRGRRMVRQVCSSLCVLYVCFTSRFCSGVVSMCGPYIWFYLYASLCCCCVLYVRSWDDDGGEVVRGPPDLPPERVPHGHPHGLDLEVEVETAFVLEGLHVLRGQEGHGPVVGRVHHDDHVDESGRRGLCRLTD